MVTSKAATVEEYLDVIARVIASTTPEQFIAMYENARKK